MGTNETILKRTQAAIETTRGTALAATRKIYAQVESSYDRPLASFTDMSGTFDGRRRAMYGREQIGFNITDIATYEDLPWWLLLGVKGGVTGTADGGSPIAYTRAFTGTASADDLATATFEHGEPGNVYTTTQVIANTWTLRGDADSDDEPSWMFEAELLGRDWAAGSYTPSILERDTNPIVTRGGQVFVHDTTIGSGLVTGKMISFSLTANNNVHLKAFMEDVSGYSAGKVGRGERLYDAQFVMEFDSDTEFAKYRSLVPAKRYVRVERVGEEIHAGATPASQRARLDMNGYWSSIAFGDREGNMTATFGLAAFTDPTSGYALSASVVNDLATLP